MICDHIEKRGKVIDLGCGTGRDAIFLAKEGYDVTAMDISRRGTMYAGAWAREAGVEVTFLTQDLLDGKQPEKSYDAILCVNVIEYMDARTRRRAGHEIWRLAKEGGLVGLMLRSTEDPELRKGNDLGDNTWEVFPGLAVHFFTEREIRQLVPDFEPIHSEVVTVKEMYPQPVDHRYWLHIGRRP